MVDKPYIAAAGVQHYPQRKQLV